MTHRNLHKQIVETYMHQSPNWVSKFLNELFNGEATGKIIPVEREGYLLKVENGIFTIGIQGAKEIESKEQYGILAQEICESYLRKKQRIPSNTAKILNDEKTVALCQYQLSLKENPIFDILHDSCHGYLLEVVVGLHKFIGGKLFREFLEGVFKESFSRGFYNDL